MANIAKFKRDLLNHITCKSPLIYIKSFDFNFIHEVLFEVLRDDLGLDVSQINDCISIWDHRNSCRSFNRSIHETDKDIKLDDYLQEINDEIEQEADRDENLDECLRGFIQNNSFKILVLKEPFEITNAGEKYLNATTISLLHNFACMNEKRNDKKRSIIIIISCDDIHISELDPYFQRINEPLPDFEDIISEMGLGGEIEKTLDDMNNSFKLGKYHYGRYFLQDDNYKKVVNSFLGMRMHDIRKVLHDITLISDNDSISPIIKINKDDIITFDCYINQKKKEIVSSSGLLEIVEYKEKHYETVGNIDALTNHVDEQKIFLKNPSEAFKNLPTPKGILLVGAPGCGKSESVKAIASRMELPLLRLNIGKLMGRYVGQSENNLINAIYTAEAAQPCVLWIDELEKAFAGFSNDGENDITVTRMIGYFLTWMQEHKTLVYLVATANNLKNLKPELLRKGRWDEIFYLSYPDNDGVKKIIVACLNKYVEDNTIKEEVKEFFYDIVDLISKSYLSGAEIDDLIVQYLRKLEISKNEIEKIQNEIKDSITDIARHKSNKIENELSAKTNSYKLSIIGSGGCWNNDLENEIRNILQEEIASEKIDLYDSLGYKSAASEK